LRTAYTEKQCCQFSRELNDALRDFIDADFGLLDALQGVLSERQYESIDRCKGYERNDKLMRHVRILPEDDFFSALRATSQQHVINFINQERKEQNGMFYYYFKV
jgi:hypothetical protein